MTGLRAQRVRQRPTDVESDTTLNHANFWPRRQHATRSPQVALPTSFQHEFMRAISPKERLSNAKDTPRSDLVRRCSLAEGASRTGVCLASVFILSHGVRGGGNVDEQIRMQRSARAATALLSNGLESCVHNGPAALGSDPT